MVSSEAPEVFIRKIEGRLMLQPLKVTEIVCDTCFVLYPTEMNALGELPVSTHSPSFTVTLLKISVPTRASENVLFAEPSPFLTVTVSNSKVAAALYLSSMYASSLFVISTVPFLNTTWV